MDDPLYLLMQEQITLIVLLVVGAAMMVQAGAPVGAALVVPAGVAAGSGVGSAAGGGGRSGASGGGGVKGRGVGRMNALFLLRPLVGEKPAKLVSHLHIRNREYD